MKKAAAALTPPGGTDHREVPPMATIRIAPDTERDKAQAEHFLAAALRLAEERGVPLTELEVDGLRLRAWRLYGYLPDSLEEIAE